MITSTKRLWINLLAFNDFKLLSLIDIQSTLNIPNCKGTIKFVRDIESSTYRVVILCNLISMGPIVLFKTSRVRLIKYLRYRDLTVHNEQGTCDQCLPF